jgi:hypothetical protein
MWWIALAVVLAVGPASAADPVTVTVLTPDGKRAAGAKVWAYFYPNDDEPPPAEPTPVVTGADGRAAVTIPDEPPRSSGATLFARDTAGRTAGGHARNVRVEARTTAPSRSGSSTGGRPPRPRDRPGWQACRWRGGDAPIRVPG